MAKTLDLVREFERPPSKILRLSREEIAGFWPELTRDLERYAHIWHPYWTVDYLFLAAMAGRMQIWGCGDEKVMQLLIWTQISDYPSCRALQLVLALGSRVDEVLPALELELEKFARAEGCDICEVIGRRGWWPKLKSSGFRRQGTIYVKGLESRSVQ